MGLFYIEQPSDDEYQETVNSEAEIFALECIERTKNSPASAFPDYLWTVAINEFSGDNYKMMGMCTDPELKLAYDIGVKQNNYHDYMDAVSKYNAYVDYVESKFGDWNHLVQLKDIGKPLVLIPRAPRLSHKKKNKRLLRSGVVLSSKRGPVDFDFNVLMEDFDDLPSLDTLPDDYELPKWYIRSRDNWMEKKYISDRLLGIYRTHLGGISAGSDAIVSFLTSGAMSTAPSVSTKSLSAEMEEIHRFDYIPKDIVDAITTVGDVYIENGYQKKDLLMDHDTVLTSLAKSGFRTSEDAKSQATNKQVVKAVRSIEDSGKSRSNMTPKEIKKARKKDLRDRKSREQRISSDRRMMSLMNTNKLDIGGFEDFTLNDIFKNGR